jgi:hypothetical protein
MKIKNWASFPMSLLIASAMQLTTVQAQPHMHGDRSHTHGLPTQGIGHKHGNGPAGHASGNQQKQSNHQTNTKTELSKELLEAVSLGYMDIVVDLVKRGADINYQNAYLETPMHQAAARGHLKVMKYLVDHGARLSPITTANWTPLHHAVRFGHHDTANYLLENGVRLDINSSEGTVFDIAKARDDDKMLDLLQRYKPQKAKERALAEGMGFKSPRREIDRSLEQELERSTDQHNEI